MKRMTDVRLRQLCEQDPGLNEADSEEVLAELFRARDRVDQLEAILVQTVRNYSQGYKLTPAEFAAMKAALESDLSTCSACSASHKFSDHCKEAE